MIKKLSLSKEPSTIRFRLAVVIPENTTALHPPKTLSPVFREAFYSKGEYEKLISG
jgi:hypothetical protein